MCSLVLAPHYFTTEVVAPQTSTARVTIIRFILGWDFSVRDSSNLCLSVAIGASLWVSLDLFSDKIFTFIIVTPGPATLGLFF